MKKAEAQKLVCPFISNFVATLDGGSELLTQNCICDKCMFWVTTANGRKEIDRVIEPYDMTPMDIRQWARNKEREGYENIGRQNGGFRNYYAKYEEVYEGYCKLSKD